MEQVTISVAKKEDVSFLKKMWKDIFCDSDDYIELYFSYKFKEGNTFVAKDGEKIVATLYVEYTDVYFNGDIKKGAYFCGIATLKEFRGKGIAKKLIEYAKDNIKKVDIIYLIPANEPLFDFYKQTGFKVFTFLSKEEVIKDKKIKLDSFKEEYDYNTVNFFYENSGNKLYIKRDKNFFDAIYNCYKNIMIFEDGYVFYYVENDILHLVEYSFCEEKAKEILKGILNLKNLDKGIFYKKYGSVPFSVCITDIDIEGIDRKYVNLMLN